MNNVDADAHWPLSVTIVIEHLHLHLFLVHGPFDMYIDSQQVLLQFLVNRPGRLKGALEQKDAADWE
jgi:hypothetical protein